MFFVFWGCSSFLSLSLPSPAILPLPIQHPNPLDTGRARFSCLRIAQPFPGSWTPQHEKCACCGTSFVLGGLPNPSSQTQKHIQYVDVFSCLAAFPPHHVFPCSPTWEHFHMWKCSCVWGYLPPDTKNAPNWACFLCSVAYPCSLSSAPHSIPSARHEKCTHLGTFFVFGCLLTAPLQPNMKVSPNMGHFRVWGLSFIWVIIFIHFLFS